MYDGFYAVSTNLEDDDIQAIINVSEERWQIEECFQEILFAQTIFSICRLLLKRCIFNMD